MTRWITPDDDEGWTALFTGYRESAYRLECQQVYCSETEDENLAQFLSGGTVEVDWTWFDETTARRAKPERTKIRVRVVVEPPTPYTRLELSWFPRMIQAGNDVKNLAVPMGEWPAGQPDHDYWLFDDRDLWLMHYHENFHFKGAELVEDLEVVQQHRHWRDLALAEAMPLAEYLASRRPETKEHSPG